MATDHLTADYSIAWRLEREKSQRAYAAERQAWAKVQELEAAIALLRADNFKQRALVAALLERLDRVVAVAAEPIKTK